MLITQMHARHDLSTLGRIAIGRRPSHDCELAVPCLIRNGPPDGITALFQYSLIPHGHATSTFSTIRAVASSNQRRGLEAAIQPDFGTSGRQWQPATRLQAAVSVLQSSGEVDESPGPREWEKAGLAGTFRGAQSSFSRFVHNSRLIC
jgi:hypothetical protein